MIDTPAGSPDALTVDADGSRFSGHSIFEQATAESVPVGGSEQGAPGWLEEARESVTEPGRYLAFSIRGEPKVVPVEEGWTRVGRSAVADIQLEDASVSRRHALIVSDADRGLRVLDDRSLNGVYLNGDRVDWGVLEDGDELRIGRFRLFVIDTELAETPS